MNPTDDYCFIKKKYFLYFHIISEIFIRNKLLEASIDAILVSSTWCRSFKPRWRLRWCFPIFSQQWPPSNLMPLLYSLPRPLPFYWLAPSLVHLPFPNFLSFHLWFPWNRGLCTPKRWFRWYFSSFSEVSFSSIVFLECTLRSIGSSGYMTLVQPNQGTVNLHHPVSLHTHHFDSTLLRKQCWVELGGYWGIMNAFQPRAWGRRAAAHGPAVKEATEYLYLAAEFPGVWWRQ